MISEDPVPYDVAHSAHAKPSSVVLSWLDVSADTGLDRQEARARLIAYGRNRLRDAKTRSSGEILLSQFRSPIVYLLMVAAMLALMFGELPETVAIVSILVINSTIGFLTESRAARSMEALRNLTTREALARRSGEVLTVDAEELVPGDIVVLDAGDIPSADMRIISSSNLSCDESALTGESMPVAKSVDPVAADTALADRSCMLYRGSPIVRGTGEAVVTATGMYTELGRVSNLVDEAAPERSPLEKQLEVLAGQLIWLTFALAAIVAGAGILTGHDLTLMVKSAIALSVAAIPEGLPIVATLSLALGVLRMARYNALINKLSAVETLGATTVILTDKTGTLTENRMHAAIAVTSSGEFVFDHDAGQFLRDGVPVDIGENRDLKELLTTATLCNNAAISAETGNVVGDPMEVALLEAARAAGMERSRLLGEMPELAEHAFDAATRMMATVHQTSRGYRIAVKGAPESVFDVIESTRKDNRSVRFEEKMRGYWDAEVERLGKQGLRLLAIAGKTAGNRDVDPYTRLTLCGLVAFIDPPRQDVRRALEDAQRAGITVIMVTGDHASTASHIAGATGLAPAGAATMSGPGIAPFDTMSEEQKARLREIRIFSRVTPEQKLLLIGLHQQAGEVVAMTGDGVNDAPALKKADIGIAMGIRGTQIAREAADLILRDDAFSTITHAISEGRIIYANIRRFATYLLSCNLSEVLVVGIGILAGLPLPLLPLQILFLNLVTDVFPALALGTIRGDRDILNRSPRAPAEPILGLRQWRVIVTQGTVIAMVTLLALVSAIYRYGLQGAEAATMSFYTLALAQLWHVFNMHNWRDGILLNRITLNPWVWLAIALCLLIIAIASLEPSLAALLQLAVLPANAWIEVVLFSLLPVAFRIGASFAVRIRKDD